MRDRRTDALLALSLLCAVALWGGNNVGTKVLVQTWPPIWTGAFRFCCAGLLMLAMLRWTRLLGKAAPMHPSLSRSVWLRGGLSLAIYIIVFNTALQFTAASHVAVYLGAAPVWALFWEAPNLRSGKTWLRFFAASVALAGVFVLFAPSLKTGKANWFGEMLGLGASVLWTNYGRQCRVLGAHLSGAEVSAHTMFRAGLLLLPMAAIEITKRSLQWTAEVVVIQTYCIIFGGVISFAIWNNALRQWPASKVLLFNNLIPLSMMTWAHFWLKEPITSRFWLAMGLVLCGVLLGQTNWQRLIEPRSIHPSSSSSSSTS